MAERCVSGVSRIAVLRANALGDFIQTLPALDAIKRAYPEAELTLLGRAWHAELLRDRPSPVDVVYPLADGMLGDEAGGERPDLRDSALAELRDRHFDIG